MLGLGLGLARARARSRGSDRADEELGVRLVGEHADLLDLEGEAEDVRNLGEQVNVEARPFVFGCAVLVCERRPLELKHLQVRSSQDVLRVPVEPARATPRVERALRRRALRAREEPEQHYCRAH